MFITNIQVVIMFPPFIFLEKVFAHIRLCMITPFRCDLHICMLSLFFHQTTRETATVSVSLSVALCPFSSQSVSVKSCQLCVFNEMRTACFRQRHSN